MKNNFKTVLITGHTEKYGLSILLKHLKPLINVKVLDHFINQYGDKDNRDSVGMTFRYYPQVVLTEGSPYDKNQLRKIIVDTPFSSSLFKDLNSESLKCYTMIFFAPFINKTKGNGFFNNILTVVKMSKECGIKRFIYIEQDENNLLETQSKKNIELIECLKSEVENDFSIITMKISGDASTSVKNSGISIKVLKDKMIEGKQIFLNKSEQLDDEKRKELVSNILFCLAQYPLKMIEKDIVSKFVKYLFVFKSSDLFQKFYIHGKGVFSAMLRRIDSHLNRVKRLFDVFMMMVLFHVWPEQTYRFSTRKVLPGKSRRFSKGKPVHHAFEFLESKSTGVKKIKELDLVLRGSSFDVKNLKKLKNPVYLGCLGNPINNDEKCVYFVTRRMAAYFKKMGRQVMIMESYSIDCDGNSRPVNEIGLDKCGQEEKDLYNSIVDSTQDFPQVAIHAQTFRPSSKFFSWAPQGSGLAVVYAASFLAEKINVYGWDFHMNSSPENMNYWQIFKCLYQKDSDKRSVYQLESSFINFYYAYHLSKMPNIKIHGYLGHLGKHKKLIDRIERVLFNEVEHVDDRSGEDEFSKASFESATSG